MDATLPVTLTVNGRRFAGGAARDGGGRWTVSCGAFPGCQADGYNLVRAREDLERRLRPLVAQLEQREARAKPAPTTRQVPQRITRRRREDAFAEARRLFGDTR